MRAAIFDDKGKPISNSVGQSAETIAEMAGFSVPKGTRAIVVQPVGTGLVDPLGGRKNVSVCGLWLFHAGGRRGYCPPESGERWQGSQRLFPLRSETNIEYVGSSLCVSRFVINQVSASSAGGSYFNGLAPTNTLGCGSWGTIAFPKTLTISI